MEVKKQSHGLGGGVVRAPIHREVSEYSLPLKKRRETMEVSLLNMRGPRFRGIPVEPIPWPRSNLKSNRHHIPSSTLLVNSNVLAGVLSRH